MKVKKITAIIEASSTGFGVYSDKLPGITGYGETIEKAKEDIKDAIKDILEMCEEEGTAAPGYLNDGNLEFVYKYDLPSLFAHFGMLDATNFARKINLNPSLLRQYKSGLTTASEKQKKKIEEGLHELGRQLLEVRL
ncbi:MAG TPA: type II toxin-antitoxin system HicB family antitoxin [Hanamia sp.]|nr:type II toxin-antitoxin system HicB family antitoxin [Hanamia sp.]